MRTTQPKKNLTFVNLTSKESNGNIVRKSYAKKIMENAPMTPKPLEYEDIDVAFNEFVENELGLTVNDQNVPTFTLFSNQRFSEYSQTWKHTDQEGNLLLNFKTINRNLDSNGGENQGSLWNIPGDRYYTIYKRSVLEDNGSESWEYCSMKQPYTVNLIYRVSFMTDLFENISVFNDLVNETFKSRQFYIRPNGHFIPLILDNIADESKYSVNEYRFYVQTVTIKALAYIIHEDDFKIQKFPKRLHIGMTGDVAKQKVSIDIEEEDSLVNQTINLSVKFEAFHHKTQFTIDTDMDISEIERENVRTLRIFVNDTPIFFEKGFKVKDNDTIRLTIVPFDYSEPSTLIFKGINPNYVYNENDTPEHVSQEPTKHTEIEIV